MKRENSGKCEEEEIAGEKMAMQQKEIEKLAFLFLCGRRDREILLGKEKMTFSDFERLTYLIDLLGLNEYNLEIIKGYSAQFEDKFRQVEMLEREMYINEDSDSVVVDVEKYEDWIEEFCSLVPDREIRKQIEEQIKNMQV